MAQPHPLAPSTSSSADHPGAPYQAGPQAAPTSLTGGRRGAILAACALLGMVIGVTGQQLTAPQATPAPDPTASAAPSTPLTATVTAVSPKDSSFEQKGGEWRSESYADANFGNLKSGIGLRLDLGAAKSVSAVRLTTATGPLTVELRAGDTPARDGAAYQLVGRPVQANGTTTLPASSGGPHRYWMVWVTQLPPTLKARITGDPVALG